MINSQFLSYEQSVALHKLGLNEPCLGFYDKNRILRLPDADNGCVMVYYSPGKVNLLYLLSSSHIAPTYHQAYSWIWKNKGLFGEIYVDDDNETFGYVIRYSTGQGRIERGFNTLEEAHNACIDKLIQILTS